jgi:hypothetical protein
MDLDQPADQEERRMRTTLHTTPEQLTEYAKLAHQQLARLGSVIERLEESHAAADAAYPDTEEQRAGRLGERLEEESWVASECRRVADLLYLLAVGDCGPSAAAEADPEGRSRQAHYQRRSEALGRLVDDDVLLG